MHRAESCDRVVLHPKLRASLRLAALAVLALPGLTGCSGDMATAPNPSPTVAVASIEIPPGRFSLAVGGSGRLIAVLRDAAGNVISPQSVSLTWSSSNTTIAQISLGADVQARAVGTVSISATAGSVSASASLLVTAAQSPVAGAAIVPTADSVLAGATTQFIAFALDQDGNALPDRTVTWSSSDRSSAAVDASGRVTGVKPGQVSITAAVDGKAAIAVLRVLAPVASVTIDPTLDTLSLNASRSLGVLLKDADGNTLGSRAVVWTTSNSTILPFISGSLVKAMGLGSATVTATVEGKSGTLTIRTLLRFAALAAGRDFTCGVTLTGVVVQPNPAHPDSVPPTVYCWGVNSEGQLGNNGTQDSRAPVPVAGGLAALIGSELPIAAGQDHACVVARTPAGATPSSALYCWGSGSLGQLGTGSAASSLVPVPVTGGLGFNSVSVGDRFSCGISASAVTLCWGLNDMGQLGQTANLGTLNPNPVPAAVSGTTVPTGQLSAGESHVCGVAQTSFVCWGSNAAGQLGQGTTSATPVTSPVVVSGLSPVSLGAVQVRAGVLAQPIAAGLDHTCAADAAGPRCWGSNSTGQLGISGSGNFPSPMAVGFAGMLQQVSAGTGFTCGADASGKAYCWGSNSNGQLGNGATGGSSSAPVQVLGPPPNSTGLKQIVAGAYHACLLTLDGVAYCWGRAQDGSHPAASALGSASSADSNVPVAVAGET